MQYASKMEKCKYCGGKTKDNRTVCSRCYDKSIAVKKLVKMYDVIKEDIEYDKILEKRKCDAQKGSEKKCSNKQLYLI